jgi:hypothetical protein
VLSTAYCAASAASFGLPDASWQTPAATLMPTVPSPVTRWTCTV